MKFVTDIKIGYLYEIRDNDVNNIVLTREIDSCAEFLIIERRNYLRQRVYTNKNVILEDVNSWTIKKEIISNVKETDLSFNGLYKYAFYEIGHKDLYPEYFL